MASGQELIVNRTNMDVMAALNEAFDTVRLNGRTGSPKAPDKHAGAFFMFVRTAPHIKTKSPTGANLTGFEIGVPTGIRTPVPTVKGSCPRPLDDRDLNRGGG